MQILPCEPQDFCPCPRCSEELECFQTKSGKLRWKHVNGDHSRCSLEQFQYTVDSPKVALFKKMFIEQVQVSSSKVKIKIECRFCGQTDVPFTLDGFEIGGDTLAYVSKDDSWIEWGAVATSPTRRICFCFYDSVLPLHCGKRNDSEWYAIQCTEFPKDSVIICRKEHVCTPIVGVRGSAPVPAIDYDFLASNLALGAGLLVKRSIQDANIYDWQLASDIGMEEGVIEETRKFGRCLRCAEHSPTSLPFCSTCARTIDLEMNGWWERRDAMEKLWNLYNGRETKNFKEREENLVSLYNKAQKIMEYMDQNTTKWMKKVDDIWTEKAVFMYKMYGLRMGFLDHINMDPPWMYRWMLNERVAHLIPDDMKKEFASYGRCVRCANQPPAGRIVSYTMPYCAECEILTLSEEGKWKRDSAQFDRNARKLAQDAKNKPYFREPQPEIEEIRPKRKVDSWNDAALREKAELDKKRAKKAKK